jgi:hypothetical protein
MAELISTITILLSRNRTCLHIYSINYQKSSKCITFLSGSKLVNRSSEIQFILTGCISLL